ncbi:hypothetical protein [Algoriphagus sediminis]|uniref:DUF5648 domain-containing protein n=1 Tax=Algoriphagus sediminis TaxID=3057113 RepID=A0ABT7YCE9_9BACT|nr:hypothetical protein [Algoriphagus sediminis]MDN3204146.1 hypothetical protein [Algoriphagus sediminis]
MKIKIPSFSIIFILVFGCNNLLEEPIQLDSPTFKEGVVITPDLEIALEHLGYLNPNDLKILESDMDYLIDDEIIIHKEDIEEFLKLRGEPNALIRQNAITSTTPGTKRNIPYVILPGEFSPTMENLIDQAFDRWNNIRNFNINFYRAPTPAGFGNGNWILVSATSSSTLMNANRPFLNGDVGDVLVINSSILSLYSSIKVQWMLAHSIGHLLGIGHDTDGNNPLHSLVSGTRNNMVTMYKYNITTYDSITGIPNWSGFYYTDLLGIRYLWPNDVTEKPLYSYLHRNNGWGQWTPNWNTYQYSSGFYDYYGVTGYLYTSSKPGTVPLYKYTHVSGTPYISTTPNIHITYSAFSYVGVTGHVFPSAGTDRIPVYEWYNPSVGYFFTTNAVDNYVQGPGWIGGGIAFYTLTLEE